MTNSDSKKMVEIRNISFAYSPKKKALDSISMDIHEGQIVGLLGPNGGGKTTLFKIISSLIRTYEGEVIIDGLDQKKHLSEVLRKLGVVFQSPSLDKKLTVMENLIYQANLYGYTSKEIQTKADGLLETLSIKDRKHDLVDELSGGLARRVEIVKSLLHSPKMNHLRVWISACGWIYGIF
jgi:ABC-2 type transport system ATP-binding protein